MKLSIKPVALAVTMALGASLAAHAAITPLPSYQQNVPGAGGLYLAIWNNSNTTTELVNLGMNFAGTSFSTATATDVSGTNALTSSANAATFTATTVAGYNVLQDDVGQVANFSSLFGGVSGTSYVIVSQSTAVESAITSAQLVGSNPEPLTNGGAHGAQSAINSEALDWASNTSTQNGGTAVDSKGLTTISLTNGSGPMYEGNDGDVGLSFGTAVGSAAAFYQSVFDSNDNVATAQYTYNGNPGFWFLSSTGDLSWNLITSSVSAVPLPPAVWLFASGLIGLALIGRRRNSGIGAAA